MNKLIQTLIAFSLITALSVVFAGTPAENTASTNNFNYTSPDDELAFNIQREKISVTMNITMHNMTNYNHIIIEKSIDNPDNFGQCKYITCADQKNADGQISATDRYPYPAKKGVYYRVKTFDKNDVERCYPSILLPAIETTTNNITIANNQTKNSINTNK